MRVFRRRSFVQLAALPLLPGCLLDQGGARAAVGGGTIGTNLSGMEWVQHGIRRGQSTLPNLHYAAPRKVEIAWLAEQGFRRNRLPVLWEMLQPVLHDARPNAATRAIVGEPGEFHPLYAQAITDVLDAHAAAGAKCLIDLHNYCRYRDFAYRPDGSVPGLRKGDTPLHRPLTEDPAGVKDRIFSLAPGATLTQSHFTDFWVRAARRWKDHPGLAGYGLMNEPHDMPGPGQVEASEGGGQDLAIWPTYARAAVEAIRKVDARTPIYVAGNDWSAAMSMATRNPGFPLPGENLVYEVHLYLDASSNGHSFDYDAEVRKGYSAGLGRRTINAETGVKRLAMAVDWAVSKKVKLALGEIGMPVDDPRWEDMFQRTVDYALHNGLEVYSWMAGGLWPIRSHPIRHVAGWHQHKTIEPAVAGPMQKAAGIAKATVFDDGPGWAPPGSPVTITVYARGNLAAPLTLTVGSDAGGRFSKTELTIQAGANGSDSYSFTPPANRVVTLTYSGAQVPPPRKVYSLQDPVAHAKSDLAEAAHAILARHGASKWEMAHGHTDFMQGGPAQDGQPLRAVADSGFGSSVGNPMEMLNFLNRDRADEGAMAPPVMRSVRGRKACEHLGPDTWGLWCKKAAPLPGSQPNPKSRALYDLQDEHFAIVSIELPAAGGSGVLFQASRAEQRHTSELALEGGKPQARWVDPGGRRTVLTGAAARAPGRPAVLALTSALGSQTLRVDSEVVARGANGFTPAVFSQMLIGWGFLDHWPSTGFKGYVYGAIAGKGRPSDAELAVLERYLASLAA